MKENSFKNSFKKVNRQKYKIFFDIISKIIKEWDPYSLLALGAPESEFESEVAAIIAEVKNIKSPKDAISVVSKVFSEAFEPQYFKPEGCKSTGEKIFKTLKEKELIN